MELEGCCDDLAIFVVDDVVEIARAGLSVIQVPQKLRPVCGRMTEADQPRRQPAEKATEPTERLGRLFDLGQRHAGHVRDAANEVLVGAHHERAKRVGALGRNQAGHSQVRRDRSEMRERRTLQVKIALRFCNVRHLEHHVALPGAQPNVLIAFRVEWLHRAVQPENQLGQVGELRFGKRRWRRCEHVVSGW